MSVIACDYTEEKLWLILLLMLILIYHFFDPFPPGGTLLPKHTQPQPQPRSLSERGWTVSSVVGSWRSCLSLLKSRSGKVFMENKDLGLDSIL